MLTCPGYPAHSIASISVLVYKVWTSIHAPLSKTTITGRSFAALLTTEARSSCYCTYSLHKILFEYRIFALNKEEKYVLVVMKRREVMAEGKGKGAEKMQ